MKIVAKIQTTRKIQSERVVSARTWRDRYYWITNDKGEMLFELGYGSEINE